MQDHARLRVWQRAHALDVFVHLMTHRLREHDSGALRSQLRRSVASIAANIAEGAGQATNAQFARFLHIALASNSESLNHLAKARSLGLLDLATCDHIHEELQAIRAMCIKLLQRL